MEADKDLDASGYLAARRADITRELEKLCALRGAELEKAIPGGEALMGHIFEYASRGKMLRGALVYLGAALFGAPDAKGVAETAAAMEFFQAGLLIHDDIMDRDERRRGGLAIHALYEGEARGASASDPGHLGASLAICAGDVCFFEALRSLSAAAVSGPQATSLLSLSGGELSVVGLAQMVDCRFGDLPREPSEGEILAMYRGKTARYSFSLPLAAGAALAGRDDAREAIFAIGDLAGLAFQLRDDEIGLFGDTERTGKVVGSDIRENKKTLWRARLLSRAGAEEKRRLLSLYGNPRLEAIDVEHVRHLTVALGVRSEISSWLEELMEGAKRLARELPRCEESSRSLLVSLIDWLVTRKY